MRVELGGEEVLRRAVGVADTDGIGAGVEGGGDDSVDVGGHQFAALEVVGVLIAAGEPTRYAADAFHVAGDEDLHGCASQAKRGGHKCPPYRKTKTPG
jgi:hypothetical protein